MNENFEQCFALVLKSEGGFVANPKDPGGMTNLGVTRAVWQSYVGHDVTEADMRALTPQDVMPLYKSNYWDKVNGDSLPYGVDYAVFDFAVNSGPTRAVKALQQVLNIPTDGQVGDETLSTLEEANAREVATRICETRLAFLQALPTWNTFKKGWGNRVNEVEKTAFNMVT